MAWAWPAYPARHAIQYFQTPVLTYLFYHLQFDINPVIKGRPNAHLSYKGLVPRDRNEACHMSGNTLTYHSWCTIIDVLPPIFRSMNTDWADRPPGMLRSLTSIVADCEMLNRHSKRV